MASSEEVSKRLYSYLDELGFSEERIRERICTVNKCSRARDISNKRIMDRLDVEKVFVGSTREGIGYDLQNDLDVLQIDHGIVCQKEGKISRNMIDGRTFFFVEQGSAPPGYCHLRLISTNTRSESFKRIEYAIVKRETGQFLSSDKYMTRNDDAFQSGKGFISQNTHYLQREGPSIPKLVEDDLINLKCFLCIFGRMAIDFVRAFPTDANEILNKWYKRERSHDWPSDTTINDVMSQPAYVVPTGQKGSKSEGIQWRICFNLGEIHLVQSFNNTQTKVYVLLKLIAKHILQPVSKSITSYVVKNVMFWLADKKPQKEFCEEKLLDRLEDAIIYLKESVEKGTLPCYMIPQRNLFVGKFKTGEQQLIVNKLKQILDVGKTLVKSYYFKDESASVECHKEIDDICEGLALANHFDKVNVCRIAMFSTDQMTEYFVTMFLYESRWKIILYNILFHLVPYLYTYGKQGLTNPLSIPLVKQLEKEEISENKRRLLQRQEENRLQPLTNKPSCIALATCSDEQSFFSSLVFFLLYKLLLAVIIDLGLILNIPGLHSFLLLFSDELVRLSLIVIFYSTCIIFRYRVTFRRTTFVSRNPCSSYVIPLVPKKLNSLEYKLETVLFTLIFFTTVITYCDTGNCFFRNTANFIPNTIIYFLLYIVMASL